MKYDYEYTDTFGGEANYCWVKRGTIEASTMLGAMRVAKREVGLNGIDGRSCDFGDMREFRPYRCATVLFVSWHDSGLD